MKNPLTKFGTYLLVCVILLSSAVVYAQVEISEPPVEITTYIPGDIELARKTLEIMASTTLPDIEASKIAYSERNQRETIQLLREIRDLIKHIDVSIPR